MISTDHRYVLTYNGEIYNHRELRTELEAVGYWFRSQSDSEVVLHGLAHWGSEALLRFNGMFALALWDRKMNKLLLARDRYGIKPLYYAQQGHAFAFGSEQKAITAQPQFARMLDKQALLEYFTFQNIFTDRTLLQGVHLLPAGHFATLDLATDKPALKPTQYWDYRFREPDHAASKQEYLEELDRLFRQAVNRQLVGDVELGSYLSGGMDSGSITAIAVQSFSYLKTFTCGFDLSSASGIELAFDERAKAEAMSARFKTEHYEMVLKAGDMERCLPKLAWHLEEPRVGQSYPNFYAAKLAQQIRQGGAIR
jgi:asparagine synthase (glutamine-hydrolysing)